MTKVFQHCLSEYQRGETHIMVCVSRKPTCCINTARHKQKSIVWSQIMIHTLYSLWPTRMFIERPGIRAGRGFHLPAQYCKLGTLSFGWWNFFKLHHTEPGVRQWPIFYKMGTNKRCRNNVALHYHSWAEHYILPTFVCLGVGKKNLSKFPKRKDLLSSTKPFAPHIWQLMGYFLILGLLSFWDSL